MYGTDIKTDAMDNTPITPEVYIERKNAMIYHPASDQEQEEDVPPTSPDLLRLNSPRVSSGPYSPLPVVRAREISKAQSFARPTYVNKILQFMLMSVLISSFVVDSLVWEEQYRCRPQKTKSLTGPL